jgi:hypothetical protein
MVLIALLATSGISQWQHKLCEKARNILVEKNIPHEVVDGMEDDETRKQLFFLAGKIASYPQFYSKEEEKDTVYLGNIDVLKRLIDEKSPLLSSSKKQQTEEQSQLTPLKSLRRSVVQQYSNDFMKAPAVMVIMTSYPQVKEAEPKSATTANNKRTKERRFQVLQSKPTSQGTTASKPIAPVAPQTPILPPSAMSPLSGRGYLFDDDKRSSQKTDSRLSAMPTARATQSMRPSITRGNSFDEDMPTEASPTIRTAQSLIASTARVHCFDNDHPTAVRQVMCTTPSLRPSTIRGNSFDDENSSNSDDWPAFDNMMRHISSMRPSFTRGNSFDEEPRVVKKVSKDRPGSLKVVWPPVKDNKPLDTDKEASLAETRAVSIPAISMRPSFTRGNSYDDGEQDIVWENSDNTRASTRPKTRAAPVPTSSLRPSFTRGNSYDEPEHEILREASFKDGLVSKLKRTEETETLSMQLNRLRPSVLRGDSFEDISSLSEAAPSFALIEVGRASTPPRTLLPSIQRGDSFEQNQTPLCSQPDWTTAQQMLGETKIECGKSITCALSYHSDDVPSLKKAVTVVKEPSFSKSGNDEAIGVLKSPPSPSAFVLKRKTSIHRIVPSGPWDGDAASSDDPVRNDHHKKKVNGSKKFGIASGPSWLYS